MMQMQPMPNTKGAIILGSTRSDPHVVPLFLLKLALEEQGYRVVNLRCFNTPDAFAEAARANDDTRAIVISNNNGAACEDLDGLAQALGECALPVVLGGRAWLEFTPEIDTVLRDQGITHYCADFDALLTMLAHLDEELTCPTPA